MHHNYKRRVSTSYVIDTPIFIVSVISLNIAQGPEKSNGSVCYSLLRLLRDANKFDVNNNRKQKKQQSQHMPNHPSRYLLMKANLIFYCLKIASPTLNKLKILPLPNQEVKRNCKQYDHLLDTQKKHRGTMLLFYIKTITVSLMFESQSCQISSPPRRPNW